MNHTIFEIRVGSQENIYINTNRKATHVFTWKKSRIFLSCNAQFHSAVKTADFLDGSGNVKPRICAEKAQMVSASFDDIKDQSMMVTERYIGSLLEGGIIKLLKL